MIDETEMLKQCRVDIAQHVGITNHIVVTR